MYSCSSSLGLILVYTKVNRLIHHRFNIGLHNILQIYKTRIIVNVFWYWSFFLITAVEEKVVRVAPEFTTPLEDVHTTDGGKAQFQVAVSGQPKPEITWYKDNSQVEVGEEFQITVEDNVSSLTIPDVYPEDAGEYKVVAKNDVGTITSTAVLFVESKYL